MVKYLVLGYSLMIGQTTVEQRSLQSQGLVMISNTCHHGAPFQYKCLEY